MIHVACSGFPVPVSRYWGDFPAVELSDTELAIPGEGTVRRWRRESPPGYAFTLIAPKVLAEGGFRRTKETRELLGEVATLAATLEALAVVFHAADLKPGKSTLATLKAFVGIVPTSIAHVALDVPQLKPDHVAGVNKRRVVVAYDPLTDRTPPLRELAYIRLPGPAGHRSRYDDAALAKVADACRAAEKTAGEVFCVFRNIDMHANATSLLKLLGQG